MHLISALARQAGRELAKPEVHPFGRKLHYLQFGDLVPQPSDDPQEINQAQYDILGARWPWQRSPSTIERAESNYRQAFAQHAFRALIFDYDGTLCRSRQREIPPPKPVLQHLCDLVDADVIVAIASGRGGSVRDRLRESMPKQMWGKIVLGLYNGGQISTLDENEPIEHSQASEFLSHILRIVGRLKEMGVPIASIRPSQPHQVSIIFRSGVNAKEMWFIIADALRQAGLDPSCIVHSKHSIDILEGGVNKAHLIAHIVQQNKVDPYEVLTLGDLGAWPGNDFSLLEHRFSLSVDVPSRRLDRGWKLAPESRRDVDATLWYLERIQVEANGRFRLVL
jgi:HAD superfamily hydrolase (TIGR01484 family)